jgi:uncharacterized protein YndB with AHSA1/START domain
MTEAAKSSFVYVTYIRTTPEKLWAALTTPEFTKKYWFGMNIETDWKAGSPWKLAFPDGRIADAGEIVEIEKPKRLVLRWRNQFRPELHEEGDARCVMEIEPAGEVVKLTITHEIDKPGSKLIGAVATGWPKILSSLKTLLETGTALPAIGELPRG